MLRSEEPSSPFCDATNSSNLLPSVAVLSALRLAFSSIERRLSPYCFDVMRPSASSLFRFDTCTSSSFTCRSLRSSSSVSSFCAAFASVSSRASRACSSTYFSWLISPRSNAAASACECCALSFIAASTFSMDAPSCSCRLPSSVMMPLCFRATVVASAILSRKRRPLSVRPARLLDSSRDCADRARSVSTASLSVLLRDSRCALFLASAAFCSAVACPVSLMALLMACSWATRFRVSLFMSRIAPLVSSRRFLMSSNAFSAGP